MAENSRIEWTHHTFNPWEGCSKVHAGCTNCYAEARDRRWTGGKHWGKGAPRRVTSELNWRKPLKWAKAAAKLGERHRVFCASLADVLDEEAPKEAQARLWQLIRDTARLAAPGCAGGQDGEGCDFRKDRDACPQLRDHEPKKSGRHCPLDAFDDDGEPLPRFGLDWLLLTKRPERWELIPKDIRPYVWLGTSISDQKTADEFVPRLLGARGFALRFLSVEPLVGPIDLFQAIGCGTAAEFDATEARRIGWVIAGGESGAGARLCNVGWVRDIREQTANAGVPCFVKQLGARLIAPSGNETRLHDAKGGDPSEWPGDLRVRQFPEVRHA